MIRRGVVLLLAGLLIGRCSGAPPQKPAAEVAQDAALETKIQAFMATEPTLQGLPIEVHVEAGKISLKGRVDSEEQKEKVAEVAVRAGGKLPIENEIQVGGKEKGAALGRAFFAGALVCLICPS